jgi:hypothetical protein
MVPADERQSHDALHGVITVRLRADQARLIAEVLADVAITQHDAPVARAALGWVDRLAAEGVKTAASLCRDELEALA